VLYKLCEDYPEHKRDDVIIAKIWLIGRSYAAAIERRKPKDSPVGDEFYSEVVARSIRESDIDKWFHALKGTPEDNATASIEVHCKTMRLFNKISGQDKRSLASKYLHFHFPKRFFLFDSRAASAISKLTKPVGRKLPTFAVYDDTYARFYLRCTELKKQLDDIEGRETSFREVDTVLLRWKPGKT
jgi:hypothetical protein